MHKWGRCSPGTNGRGRKINQRRKEGGGEQYICRPSLESPWEPWKQVNEAMTEATTKAADACIRRRTAYTNPRRWVSMPCPFYRWANCSPARLSNLPTGSFSPLLSSLLSRFTATKCHGISPTFAASALQIKANNKKSLNENTHKQSLLPEEVESTEINEAIILDRRLVWLLTQFGRWVAG